jgi:hypothetical protein
MTWTNWIWLLPLSVRIGASPMLIAKPAPRIAERSQPAWLDEIDERIRAPSLTALKGT